MRLINFSTFNNKFLRRKQKKKSQMIVILTKMRQIAQLSMVMSLRWVYSRSLKVKVE
jgi:hypothetical protein